MPGETEVRRLDLASLASVREFAAAWEGDLDLLINNAGIMVPPLRAHRGRLRAAARHQPPRPLRPDQPAARRHHRARRDRLLDRATASARSTSTTSTGSAGPTSPGGRTGSPSSPTCCSPPSCSAGSPPRAPACWRRPRTRATPRPTCSSRAGAARSTSSRPSANRLLAQDEDGGALPTLYAATADIPGNSYAGPGGFQEQRGAPKLVGRTDAAQDADVARRLWDVSEELTGVRFPLGAAVAA